MTAHLHKTNKDIKQKKRRNRRQRSTKEIRGGQKGAPRGTFYFFVITVKNTTEFKIALLRP